MDLRYLRIAMVTSVIVVFFARTSFPQDAIQYKKIKGRKASCDVGILYKKTPRGMDIDVSAIATGKGINFRKWKITDMKLNIEGNKIKAYKKETFYITKESFFHDAATLLFAAIGTQYKKQYAQQVQSGEVCPVTGDQRVAYKDKGTFAKAIDKAGMAAGLGLLTSQAKGDISAQRYTFSLDGDFTGKVCSGLGAIMIKCENEERHQKDKVEVDLAALYVTKVDFAFDYGKMSQDDLLKLGNALDDEIRVLEKKQRDHKYSDPEYKEIQKEIERLRGKRDETFKKWSERKTAWAEGHEERLTKAKDKLKKEEKYREDLKEAWEEEDRVTQEETEEIEKKAMDRYEYDLERKFGEEGTERDKYKKMAEDRRRKAEDKFEVDKETWDLYRDLSLDEIKGESRPETSERKIKVTTWDHVKEGLKGAWEAGSEDVTKATIPTTTIKVIKGMYKIMEEKANPCSVAGRHRIYEKLINEKKYTFDQTMKAHYKLEQLHLRLRGYIK